MKALDISGQKFGMLTALRKSGINSKGKTLWDCVCDCANNAAVLLNNLRNGNTKSCGCSKSKPSKKRINLVGQRFGRLFVIDSIDKPKNGRSYWYCKCDCGNLTLASTSDLKREVKRSCGCLKKENGSKKWVGKKPGKKSWAAHVVKDTVCIKCGIGTNLHAHHIDPASLHPDQRLSSLNGVALCARCHRKYHSSFEISSVNAETLFQWAGLPKLAIDGIALVRQHHDKNGIEDLRKAIHTIELLIEFEERKNAA